MYYIRPLLLWKWMMFCCSYNSGRCTLLLHRKRTLFQQGSSLTSLLESLVLTRPGVDSSDEVFLDHLRSSTSFSSYEEFNLVMSELKFDVRKGDVRERMSCYLRRFLQAKSRASGLKLPDSAFMIRFAKGILPLGLQKSLISRIRDEVFPDFPTLVNTAEEELLDCTRVASWNRSSKTVSENTDSVRQAGMKSIIYATCLSISQIPYLHYAKWFTKLLKENGKK
ncbi:hypothetical protein P9112_000813 [Eukaryota sp. TZLM1-RC]